MVDLSIELILFANAQQALASLVCNAHDLPDPDQLGALLYLVAAEGRRIEQALNAPS